MAKNVDRTYKTNPAKFQGDLKRKIVNDANAQMQEWNNQGKLPRWMRIKNRFSRRKVELSNNR